MPPFAPRIHVLLASHSPIGLVIRRGPSKSVTTLLWDRRKDTFQLGQWMRGRIYERRCDLSPDGQHFLYFAMNGKWESETQGAWTAISQAPYLKALVLLGKGDCWHGGGLWTNKRTYWLNDGYGHRVLRNHTSFQRDEAFQPELCFGGECLGVYFPRLVRDGWQMESSEQTSRRQSLYFFRKPLPGGWSIQKIAHAEIGAPQGKGCYWDEHAIESPSGEVVSFPSWEWAEVDGGRLVWAEYGKLFAATVGKRGVGTPVELHDFNGMKFRAIEAPY
jgi:hypothetical protein